MKENTFVSRFIMLPASKVYGMVTALRNRCFDWGLLKQHTFDVPVVVVGNIMAGGTGKTPHVEFMLEQLRYTYHIGVLSRGYKRKTKGFIAATRHSTPRDIGDEAYQIYSKFGQEVTIAVCEDRVHGIEEMLRIDPAINLIILDDAFQHRYVKPTVAVVLTEYGRPCFNDKMLPYGRLRESMRGLNRADVVVVSKCPEKMTPLEYREFKNKLNLFPYQKLYFSRFVNGQLVPLFPEQSQQLPYLQWLTEKDAVVILCGIGNPLPFVKYIKNFKAKTRLMLYDDHHDFTRKDIDEIQRRFNDLKATHKYIVTTEKDAVRLMNNPYFPHELKGAAFYVPVQVVFDRQDGPAFEEHVRKLIDTKFAKQD